jgi:hypothetical protein
MTDMENQVPPNQNLIDESDEKNDTDFEGNRITL